MATSQSFIGNYPRHCCILAALLASGELSAATYPPQDHHGQDFILAAGEEHLIWGAHTGINHFVVEEGAAVVIKEWVSGDPANTGRADISARHIVIAGTIDGVGAGFPGSAGDATGPQSVGVGCELFEVHGGYQPQSPGVPDCAEGNCIPYLANILDRSRYAAVLDVQPGIGARGNSSDHLSGGGGGGYGGASVSLNAYETLSITSSGKLLLAGGWGEPGSYNADPVEVCKGVFHTLRYGDAGSSRPRVREEILPPPLPSWAALEYPDIHGTRGSGGAVLLSCPAPGGMTLAGVVDVTASGVLKIAAPVPASIDLSTFTGTPTNTIVYGPWKSWPPQDHGGADLVISNKDRIWGTHTGVGKFLVADGVTATIPAFDPRDTSTGRLAVKANEILVAGTINASLAGYPGGPGRGGPASSAQGENIPSSATFVPAHGAPPPGVPSYLSPEGAAVMGGGPFASPLPDAAALPTDDPDKMGSGGSGGIASTCEDSGGSGGGPGGGVLILEGRDTVQVSGTLTTRGGVGVSGTPSRVEDFMFIGKSRPSVSATCDGSEVPPDLVFRGSIPPPPLWVLHVHVAGDGGASFPAQATLANSENTAGAGAGGPITLRCLTPDGMEVSGTLNTLGGLAGSDNDGLANSGIVILSVGAIANEPAESATIISRRVIVESVANMAGWQLLGD